ncbi:MAG: YihA family ribosome biogenesis GTP-binding protein [Chitinophaga sp.]|uniref:ribosome biogenesis GTP-binding protein YihA/YsxC n=1 Tax=Chitinophaga sp. TaxID=1869181 RepID=UPI001B200A71|nr:ribosome biogenesis GTP-binding protein YihA/YsxC [Chitinophaga sp.]MBO9730389.1 YihA family ribosome biogenesis GTP-binding protein [Chitinophaga sp.]
MVIKSAEYLVSSPDWEKCPSPIWPEYAFIGRSNVGKSSLINILANNEKLAKTSGTPGKTQMINHFAMNKAWYLVDLPGYGFAKRSMSQRRQWEQMIENYLRKRPNLVSVFVLIDSRHQPQKIDIDFVNQLGEWNIPFSLVFTKADKSTQAEVSKNVKAFLNKMKETWQFLPANFVTSTVKKSGRDAILNYIDELNAQFRAIA